MRLGLLLVAGFLTLGMLACDDDGVTDPTGALRPGDAVGGTLLATGGKEDLELVAFCTPTNTDNPNHILDLCTIPAGERVWAGPGWYATTQEILESNWQSIEFEMSIDGQPVDLTAFGTFDEDIPLEEGLTARGRAYDVVFVDTGGPHTVHYVLRVLETINDGFGETPPGTYEYTSTVIAD